MSASHEEERSFAEHDETWEITPRRMSKSDDELTPDAGFPGEGLLTLADVILERGATQPERVGFTFFTYRRPDEHEAHDLTYRALLDRCKAIAATLQLYLGIRPSPRQHRVTLQPGRKDGSVYNWTRSW